MSKFMYVISLIVGSVLIFSQYYLEVLGFGIIKFLPSGLGLYIVFSAIKRYKNKS